MNKQQKYFLRFKFFLFGMLILFMSCQEESIHHNHETIQEKRLKRISLNELNTKLSQSQDYNVLSSVFDVNKPKTETHQNRPTDTDNPYLSTDEIVMIVNGNITYYTFRIESDLIGDEFYNLVVAVDDANTILSTRILEYLPSAIWLQDTSQPFEGQVKVYDNDIFSTTSISSTLSSRSSGLCVTDVTTSWECGAGNDHPPGHPQCTPDNNAVTELIITVHWGPCPPSIDDGDSSGGGGFPVGGDTGGSTTGGGTNGSGTSSGNNTPDLTDDTTPLPPLRDIDCENQKQRLLELVNNPTIKTHIDGFKAGIFSDNSGNYKEDGARFAKTGNNQYTPRYPAVRNNNGLDYTPDYQPNETVSIHIHQQKYYDATISAFPFFNAPVPSDTDLIELMKNIDYINNNNPLLAEEVTQIVMTEAGVFAIVMDKQSALNALAALQDPEILDDFEKRFQNRVLKKWNKVNQNAGEVCDQNCLDDVANRFKKFVKNNKIAGNKLDAKVMQAIIDDNDEIVGWTCD